MSLLRTVSTVGVLFIAAGLFALILGIDPIGLKLTLLGSAVTIIAAGIDGAVRQKQAENLESD